MEAGARQAGYKTHRPQGDTTNPLNLLNPLNPGTKGAEPSRPKGAVHKGTHLPSDNALRAMSIKSALRIYLSVSYVMIGILRIGSLRSPPPFRLRRTSPCSGGRIKHLEASLHKQLTA